ncbi:MAG: endonuclease [Hyphomicrobiales bacterium]|nr:endonuclease [Hyphomicrobiales bacterium]
MASQRNGTLYTGVTADLSRRVHEHRQVQKPSFTRQYGCTLLVWYENYERMDEAIAREKQIKAGPRKAKMRLIETMNPLWRDLYETLA